MSEVDAELRKILARAAEAPPLHSLAVEEVRAVYRRLAEERVPMAPAVPWRALELPGAAASLPARLYEPEGAEAAPLLVFFHGGGFVMGDLETHDPLCRRLARRAGMRILSVDYRLGPEHPAPAAYEDGHAAVLSVARTLGAPFLLGGDSAGANLSAWTARRLAGEGAPMPAGLVLVYPNVSFGHDSHSRRAFGSGYLLSSEDLAFFGRHFLQGGADPSLLEADLRGLPPSLVVTAGFDPLHDEGAALVEALAAAGVAVDQLDFPELVHGFANLAHLSAGAAAAVEAIADAIARAWPPGTARNKDAAGAAL